MLDPARIAIAVDWLLPPFPAMVGEGVLTENPFEGCTPSPVLTENPAIRHKSANLEERVRRPSSNVKK